MTKAHDTYQVLMNYAFRLLGRKSYSEAELNTRFFKRGKKLKLENLDKAIPQIIKRLKELDYVNDGKLIESYLDYKLHARPLGKFAYMIEMRRKGISAQAAGEAWDKRGIKEEELALNLLKNKAKRFQCLKPLVRKKKIAALLAGRGFNPEIIWRILEKV